MQEEPNIMTHDLNTRAATIAEQRATQQPTLAPVKRAILKLPIVKRAIMKRAIMKRANITLPAMMVPPEVADPGLIRIGAAVGQRPGRG